MEFLSALTAVGDVSCLEPIAAAFDRAGGSGGTREDWWHRHLASAFRVIVTRERVTRRHQVARKIERRWKGVLTALYRTVMNVPVGFREPRLRLCVVVAANAPARRRPRRRSACCGSSPACRS